MEVLPLPYVTSAGITDYFSILLTRFHGQISLVSWPYSWIRRKTLRHNHDNYLTAKPSRVSESVYACKAVLLLYSICDSARVFLKNTVNCFLVTIHFRRGSRGGSRGSGPLPAQSLIFFFNSNNSCIRLAQFNSKAQN